MRGSLDNLLYMNVAHAFFSVFSMHECILNNIDMSRSLKLVTVVQGEGRNHSWGGVCASCGALGAGFHCLRNETHRRHENCRYINLEYDMNGLSPSSVYYLVEHDVYQRQSELSCGPARIGAPRSVQHKTKELSHIVFDQVVKQGSSQYRYKHLRDFLPLWPLSILERLYVMVLVNIPK